MNVVDLRATLPSAERFQRNYKRTSSSSKRVTTKGSPQIREEVREREEKIVGATAPADSNKKTHLLLKKAQNRIKLQQPFRRSGALLNRLTGFDGMRKKKRKVKRGR
jgi:hypothetical protein